MAMTADGKIAPAHGGTASFASSRDHDHLLELRATADAVMSGARTVDSNPVNLGPGQAKYRRLRLKNGLSEYNLRVVVSGGATLNPAAEIFRHRFGPIIILVSRQAPRARLAALRKAGGIIHECGDAEVDFKKALHWLHQKWGVRRLLCEGGAILNGALIQADLIDDLHLTICPRLLGGREAPTICDGPGSENLAQAARFTLISQRRVGDEIFLIYQRRIR